jgi:hypothetical protein
VASENVWAKHVCGDICQRLLRNSISNSIVITSKDKHIMRTKKGFRLRELGGDYILIGESAELVNFNNIITFNEAAAYLWQNVQGKDFDVETLTQLLLDEYEVTEDIAREDAQATIDDWLEIGIIR